MGGSGSALSRTTGFLKGWARASGLSTWCVSEGQDPARPLAHQPSTPQRGSEAVQVCSTPYIPEHSTGFLHYARLTGSLWNLMLWDKNFLKAEEPESPEVI